MLEFPGRLEGGVARHVKHPGGCSRTGQGGQGRIGDIDLDLLQGNAKLLANDLAKGRSLATAQILYAAPDHHAAVQLQLDEAAGTIMEEGQPAVTHHPYRQAMADADILILAFRHRAQSLPGLLGRLGHRHVTIELEVGSQRIALAQAVLLSDG